MAGRFCLAAGLEIHKTRADPFVLSVDFVVNPDAQQSFFASSRLCEKPPFVNPRALTPVR